VIYFSRPEYWTATPLVPWFAWSVVPLILSNVLLSNLLARERFAIVPWALLIAAGYGVALAALKPHLLASEHLDAFRTVIQTFGIFNLLLFGVAGLFTWRDKRRSSLPRRDG
jgi:hypothetical protein